jgi:hypothetical protein
VPSQPASAKSSSHRGIVYSAFALAALLVVIVVFRVARSFLSLRPGRIHATARAPEPSATPAKKPPPAGPKIMIYEERPAPRPPETDSVSELTETNGSSVVTEDQSSVEPMRRAEAEASTPAPEPQPVSATAVERAAATEHPAPSPVRADDLPAHVPESVSADGDGEGAEFVESEPAVERCDIAYWRGYRKAAFYARAFDEEGLEVALAESEEFRARGNGTPERTEAAAAAHKALMASLVEAGWTKEGEGELWYDARLTRE